MQRARATASALALLLAAGALGCGASLDDPVPNLEACQTLTVALAAKCGSELQFLNCDMLPGCPGGNVERADIEACEGAINDTPDCTSAKLVECGIAKVGCSTLTDERLFTPAIGYANACDQIVAGLQPKCGATPDSDCPNYLEGCKDSGAFSQADLNVALDIVSGAADCTDAKDKLATSNIRNKFCYETTDSQ